MPTTGLNPYNLNKLLGGAARVLYAPNTVSIPTKLTDVINTNTTTYAPKTGWIDFGATAGAFAYNRAIAESGYNIEQDTSDVIEEITAVDRTVTVPVAEIKQSLLAIIEEGTTGSTSAGANQSAESLVKFGMITSLTRYRIAFIARRAKGIGSDVTQSDAGTTVRGAFVAGFLYNVALAADTSSASIAKGSLVSLPVSFRAYPESSLSQGQEYGVWVEETSGTISPT